MRIVYMGTPDFSVPALTALYEYGHDIAGVVTQPDRPKGRKGKVSFPPVKEEALRLGLEVSQPVRIKDADSVAWLRSKEPELVVVAAFGQLLSKEILDIPKYGCINIHASLLPRLRGASPIQQAVIDGDCESGITIMMMDEGLDTGGIIMQESVEITSEDTGGSLHDKLSDIGGRLIIKAVDKIASGDYKVTPQKGESTYAGMIDKKRGLIDFSMDAESIERLIRGLNPWPSAYTYIHGKLLKIWKAEVISETSGSVPGEITDIAPSGITVSCKKGSLKITELQPEGKKRMKTADYINGTIIDKGTVLGLD